MDKIAIKIREDKNQTIKEFLKESHIGRSKIEEIRTQKLAYLNGNNVSIETVLSKGDLLEIEIKETVDFASDHEELEIVYEDNYLLVVNKPAGIIIHGETKEEHGTLSNRVAYYYRKNNIHRYVRYLHRIDKDTTGLVLFAKDFFTEGLMIKKLEEEAIDRYYCALAKGKFEKNRGEIIASIGTDRHVNGKMCISNSEKAKYAKTGYEVLDYKNGVSLVKFKLYTGRTHQIRVHSASIGHPLLGDKTYGWVPDNRYPCEKKISRVCLHSLETKFIHPIKNSEIIIKTTIPEYHKQILSKHN